MRREIFLVALMLCVLGVSAARAADCNYDIKKTSGQAAWDVEVVLHGNVSFSGFWDNLGDGLPTITVSGGTTSLHWVKTPPGPIGTDEWVHVGFTDDDGKCPCGRIYFTDQNHKRIPASYVGTAEYHPTGDRYSLTNCSPWAIQVHGVNQACQATARPLGVLNRVNSSLASAMVQIAGPATLAPGQSLALPSPPCTDCYCVTNFRTSGSELNGEFEAWEQEYVGSGVSTGGK